MREGECYSTSPVRDRGEGGGGLGAGCSGMPEHDIHPSLDPSMMTTGMPLLKSSEKRSRVKIKYPLGMYKIIMPNTRAAYSIDRDGRQIIRALRNIMVVKREKTPFQS